MIDFSHFNNLISVVKYFSNKERLKQTIAESRWADGDVVCPYCGQHHCATRKDGRYRCNNCKSNFSVTVGTIFENSKLPLSTWFIAMYLISSHKKGISSHQLARDLHVSQKTAWFMLMRIRSLYSQDNEPIEGNIELDEAYIGGKEKWKHAGKKTEGTQGRSTKTKAAIFGINQREGKVNVRVVEDTKGNTLSLIIRQFVKEGSRIFTDEYIGYNSLNASEYSHSVVFHNAGEFVVGDAHTNGMEGFWGHFKRMISGIYHFCSRKHLQDYVNEQVFRWNTRKDSEAKRFEDMFDHAIKVVRQNDFKLIRRYHKKAA